MNNFLTQEFTTPIISYFTVVLLLMSILITGSNRLKSIVKFYLLQSSCLVIITLIIGFSINNPETLRIAIITLLGKCIVIPLALNFVIDKSQANKEVVPIISPSTTVLIASALIAFVYGLSMTQNFGRIAYYPGLFNAAISIILIGLLIMISRKKALTQIIGLYVMENGIFALTLDTVFGMPFVVEMGISLDLFIGVLIMGVWTLRIKQSFDSIDVSKLSKLKG
jgi:hydrogenase-4 component E